MVDPVELQTNRLLLRQFRLSDVDDVLAYRDDAEFSRYLPHIPQPFTRRDAEEFVARNIADPWDKYPTFAVVLNDAVIGTVNFDVDQAQCIAMLGFAKCRPEVTEQQRTVLRVVSEGLHLYPGALQQLGQDRTEVVAGFGRAGAVQVVKCPDHAARAEIHAAVAALSRVVERVSRPKLFIVEVAKGIRQRSPQSPSRCRLDPTALAAAERGDLFRS